MATLWVQRRGQALIPTSAAEAGQIERLPEGVALRAEVVQPRNGKHHRLIWALFSSVADALNDGPAPSAVPWTAEKVAEMCKLATGRAEKRPATKAERRANSLPEGATVLIPASISYASMDERAFGEFAGASVDFIAAELCPWWRESESADAVMELLEAYGVRVPA